MPETETGPFSIWDDPTEGQRRSRAQESIQQRSQVKPSRRRHATTLMTKVTFRSHLWLAWRLSRKRGGRCLRSHVYSSSTVGSGERQVKL